MGTCIKWYHFRENVFSTNIFFFHLLESNLICWNHLPLLDSSLKYLIVLFVLERLQFLKRKNSKPGECIYSRCSGTACHLSMCKRKEIVSQESQCLRFKNVLTQHRVIGSARLWIGSISRFCLLVKRSSLKSRAWNVFMPFTPATIWSY